MLTSPHPIEAVSKRSGRRLRELWHDSTQHTPSLGCMGCPERQVCGGLHISAPLFSCLDHCCGHPESCDVVCRNNPTYVDRVREIGGFDLNNIPRANPIAGPNLPKFIPLLFHGGQREEPFVAEAVCLPLYAMFKRRTGEIRFESRAELNNAFKVSSDATIILTGTENAPPWKDGGA